MNNSECEKVTLALINKCDLQNTDWSLCFSSVFGQEVNAGEQNNADHALQQDLFSFSNVDFDDWGGVERNYLVSRNHTTLQDREKLVDKTALYSLQNNTCKNIKTLPPRVLNRVTFSQNTSVQNPHNDVVAKSVKLNSSSIATSEVPNVCPADLIEHNELDGVDPHLFDLSLSPILDVPPCEGENTISPQAQLNKNATIITAVTSYPETENENKNIIPFSNQENSAITEVAVGTNIMKEITSDSQFLQYKQNLHPGKGEIIIPREERGNRKDLLDLEKNKATFIPSSNATLYTDNQRSPIDEQDYKLLSAAVGENLKPLEENTELDHCSMNVNMSIPSTLTSIVHVKAIDAEPEDDLPTAAKHTDSEINAQPLTMESVNKLNADTDDIMRHESEHSVENTNMLLGIQKVCNESMDIYEKSTYVSTQNKTQECNDKEKSYTETKDMTQESEDVQAINENAIIFNTSCEVSHYSEFDGEEQENIIHHKVSSKSEISNKTRTRSQVIGSSEQSKTQDRFMTPKKPMFRAPYKIVSESPIIGYPQNRRNITSTPKETQKKKILRFGSGYSSDSSDTSDGIRKTGHYETKCFTANGDIRPGEQHPAPCLNSVEKKPEFKPKFVSKLSAFKFSVDSMKKKQNESPLCLKGKNAIEATKHLSSNSQTTLQENLNLSESSTMSPDICYTTGSMHPKAKNRLESSFAKTRDKLQNNKYARKLDKFRCNKDQSVSPAVSEDIPGTKKSCSFQTSMEASKKVSSHVRGKGSTKRKKENQEHVTVRKRNKSVSESHSPTQTNNDGKKTRKRNPSSLSKSSSEDQLPKKSKNDEECVSICKNQSKKGKSDKSTDLKDLSQESVNLSQIGPVQQLLGNEAQLLAVSKYLTSAQEFCITLLYRDNSSQLREKVSGARKQHPGNGQVTGFALRVTWAADSAPPRDLLPKGYSGELTECCSENLSQEDGKGRTQNLSNKNISAVYKLSLGINFNKEGIRSVVNCIMRSEAHKIGFDAQESITFLVEKLEIDHREVTSSWIILDPKIGGWLINSDHPPITFQQTANALKVSLPESGIGKRPEEEIHQDMEALSLVAAALHTRLVQLNLWTIFLHLEMRITPILAVMELRDIRVDRVFLKEMGQRLKLKIEEIERRCHQVSGLVFNVASHVQLRSVLYQELKLDLKTGVAIPRTTKGQKSTCEAALGRLKDLHPLPGLVLQHRLLNKLKTTYVDGILACLHGSCVRAAWEQTAASTGRIQCHHPNLQNIPKQPVTVEVDGSEMIVKARECFCSREGHVLVSADFQQTELRVLAHLSQDAELLAGFRQPNNTDIFKQLTATWLEKAASDVTSYERERTKRVVYGVMYGAGREKLSEVLHITPSEASDIVSSFAKRFPSIPAYIRSVINTCRQRGFLTTIFRRRRFFPNITSHDTIVQSQAERQAVNFIIQGSAADLSKAAMIQTEAALAHRPEMDAKLLMHIHDELVWEVHTDHTQNFCDMIGCIMEDTQQLCGTLVQLTVPLPVTVSTGTNWADMHPLRCSLREQP